MAAIAGSSPATRRAVNARAIRLLIRGCRGAFRFRIQSAPWTKTGFACRQIPVKIRIVRDTEARIAQHSVDRVVTDYHHVGRTELDDLADLVQGGVQRIRVGSARWRAQLGEDSHDVHSHQRDDKYYRVSVSSYIAFIADGVNGQVLRRCCCGGRCC